MRKLNGHDLDDEGLLAIKASFKGASFLDTDAYDAATLMQAGEHRKQDVPDTLIMEIYGSITEGKNICLERKYKSGGGYIVKIENYKDLVQFIQGDLLGHEIEQETYDGL